MKDTGEDDGMIDRGRYLHGTDGSPSPYREMRRQRKTMEMRRQMKTMDRCRRTAVVDVSDGSALCEIFGTFMHKEGPLMGGKRRRKKIYNFLNLDL
ncbi:hypothetical protein ACS0TY_031391 [Phlomoides rotata]